MAQLTHANAVAIHDYGRTADGVFYYAMEYLDGIDLEGLVEVDGPQPPGRVIHVLRQALGALAQAHRSGLIHRDVKPANIFLCRDRGEPDVVKVLDFGLVKDVRQHEDDKLTGAQAMIGTPLYMAPEAIRDAASVDARSDLYALGAVGYLLLAGVPVFGGRTSLEVCAHHLHTRPTAPSERLGRALPADLEQVVMRCLEKAPSKRFESAGALSAALDRCADASTWKPDAAEAWWIAKQVDIERRRSRRKAVSSGIDSICVDPAERA